MREVSIEVVSVRSETTLTSAAAEGCAGGAEPLDEGSAAMEPAAALAAGSAASLAALAAAAPPAESV